MKNDKVINLRYINNRVGDQWLSLDKNIFKKCQSNKSLSLASRGYIGTLLYITEGISVGDRGMATEKFVLLQTEYIIWIG